MRRTGSRSTTAPLACPASPPSIERSIVEGGCPLKSEGSTTPLDCEEVLDADPLFVRAPGADGPFYYGDLRLSEGSPGVDAGLASLLPEDRWDLDGDGDTEEPLPLDLADGPRVLGTAPDLGAYEGTVPVAVAPEPDARGVAFDVYPNPARSPVAVGLDLPRSQRVAVELFDALGRRVAVLHDGPLAVGRHTLRFRTSGLPSGVYLLRLRSDTASLNRCLVVLR